MNFPTFDVIRYDLNVSVIVVVTTPQTFITLLTKNGQELEGNGLEVILVVKNDFDAIFKDVYAKYNLINWIMVSTGSETSITDMIYLGFQYTTKEHILVSEIDVLFTTDFVFRMLFLNKYYPDDFLTVRKLTLLDAPQISPVSSLLCSRLDFVSAVKFIQAQNKIDEVLLLMSMNLVSKGKTRFEYVPDNCAEANIGYENLVRLWGLKDISTKKKIELDVKHLLISSYLEGSFRDEQLSSYLNNFLKVEMHPDFSIKKKYKILALIQTYNETGNIKYILSHLQNLCDGVILLDDESIDGTYENAFNEKLLIKLQKKRDGFNDLKNRNILLDITNFLDVDWLLFIDADERFDVRYCDLYSAVCDSKEEAIAFWWVNLWDSEEEYRADLEDSGKYSKKGLLSRTRMFKTKIERQQIVLRKQRKLHFPPIPYPIDPYPANILLIHHGIKNEKSRVNKYNFYNTEDEDKNVNKNRLYNYLLDENVELKKINSIEL